MSTSKSKYFVGNHCDSPMDGNGSVCGSGNIHIQGRNDSDEIVGGQFHPTLPSPFAPIVSQNTISALEPNTLKSDNFTNGL